METRTDTGPKLLMLVSIVGVLALVLLACGSPEPTPTPVSLADEGETTLDKEPWEIEWEETIAKAQEEGELVIIGGSAAVMFRPVFRAFGDKFGIDVRSGGGSTRQLTDRIFAERDAGRYTVDHVLGGAGNYNTRLIPRGIIAPIADAFILPEVEDPSNWYLDRHWYLDVKKPGKYAFAFAAAAPVGGATLSAWVNTDLVSQQEIDELRSLWDLVAPKWNGRVVARQLDEDSLSALLNLYTREELGPEWLTRFLSTDLNVNFHGDFPLMSAQLARGSYALCFCSGANDGLEELRALGAPVFRISEHAENVDWKEVGGTLSIGGSRGIFSWVDRPANPNAAKLMVNWFLSKEGQTAYHTISDGLEVNPTLRKDVTEMGITNPEEWRKPGVEYPIPVVMWDNAEEIVEEARALIRQLWVDRGGLGF